MDNKSKVDITKRTLKFGINITKYYLYLKDKKYFEVANQIFRSGTSIGANIMEAQGGQSKKDFIHKLSIALKEGYETLYWLNILEEGFDEKNLELKQECEEIVKIITTIIKNTKLKLNKSKKK